MLGIFHGGQCIGTNIYFVMASWLEIVVIKF